jgi:hypothetical protein
MTDMEIVDMETGELVPYQPSQPPSTLFGTDDPLEVVNRATRVADSLAAVIRKQNLTVAIQGRDHVRVEGWTLLGTMLGVYPVCTWTRKLEEGGWEARVEARTRDGSVVGAAEAQCDRSEKTWAKRDDYALRSMAQTRATSKAMRQPLGFVMSMAGFEATPAEEMPTNGHAPVEAAPATTTKPVRRLIAEVSARSIKLGANDPTWTLAAIVSAAEKSFGHEVTGLADLDDDELQQILEAMPV